MEAHTRQQFRGIIYSLNSKVIYLVLLLRHLLNVSELMMEFKIRARLFNSTGKLNFVACKGQSVHLAPSVMFWYLLQQLILTPKLLNLLSLLKCT